MGTSIWSGPYQEGGGIDATLDLWAEPRLSTKLGLRVEAGVSGLHADFGPAGFLSDGTSLSQARLQVAAVMRFYPGAGGGSLHPYLEAGGALWKQRLCDVDQTGGPGFFGGSTESCDQWRPEFESTTAPLSPSESGTQLIIGAGVRISTRLAIGVRYAPIVGAVIETTNGDLRAQQLLLMGEWAFGR